MVNLEQFIRDVPDFPKKGIIFKDITPLLANYEALRETTARLVQPFEQQRVDVVAAIESRGFIFGSLVAQRLKAGFVPLRKPNKLPWKTKRATYDLEYGSDAIEIHADAIEKGQSVLMVDDLLATGGTMGAACELVDALGGRIIGAAFVIELAFLSGRAKLASCATIHSLIKVLAE